MPRTVHVVTWDPTNVGGFEWRTDRAEAERIAADFRIYDDTVHVHAVTIPDDVENVTDWLDTEGWSDGGPTTYSRAAIVNGTGWAPGIRFAQILPDGTSSRTTYSRAAIVNGTGWARGARFIVAGSDA